MQRKKDIAKDVMKKKLWCILERYGVWQKAKFEWEKERRDEMFREILELYEQTNTETKKVDQKVHRDR